MSGPSAKILIADDDLALLDTLSWILKDKGFEVVALPGGEGLLERIDDEKPDLLMLDIMMPKLDGLQILERLRTNQRWQDLPILMISSMPPEDATARSLGLGASDFIAKPFRVKELVARVEAQLRAGRRLKQAREEVRQHAEETAARDEMVDILHEVTDALAPEEIYHILTRRVAKVLDISKCSLVMAEAGDEKGLVVVTADNPMLRNLEIPLTAYPEIRKALETGRPVLVEDVHHDSLFVDVRKEWRRSGQVVPTKSVITVPFTLRDRQVGVFFLRRQGIEPPLTKADLHFAERVVRTAVNAIDKAYELQSAQSDRARYQRLASTDALTGCLNRRALVDKLDNEMDRAQRYGLALTILLIDLDHFKSVNDTMGHLAGDTVLQQIGELLLREVRSVDVVARYGGEEFMIVLPETDQEGGVTFAERIRERVEEHEFVDLPSPVKATVSIGVAAGEGGELTTPEDLIARADQALYRAKDDGRNLVRS